MAQYRRRGHQQMATLPHACLSSSLTFKSPRFPSKYKQK